MRSLVTSAPGPTHICACLSPSANSGRCASPIAPSLVRCGAAHARTPALRPRACARDAESVAHLESGEFRRVCRGCIEQCAEREAVLLREDLRRRHHHALRPTSVHPELGPVHICAGTDPHVLRAREGRPLRASPAASLRGEHRYTHTHTHARTHTHKHTHAQTHTRTNTPTHARTHTHTEACTRAHTHARTRAHTHTRARHTWHRPLGFLNPLLYGNASRALVDIPNGANGGCGAHAYRSIHPACLSIYLSVYVCIYLH